MPDTHVSVEIPEQTLSVQVSIRLSDLPVNAVVNLHNEQGRTQAQPDVILTIPFGGSKRRTVTAKIKGRSFRRIMNEISVYQNPPERLVLVGRLNSHDEIEGAGFLPINITTTNDIGCELVA